MSGRRVLKGMGAAVCVALWFGATSAGTARSYDAALHMGDFYLHLPTDSDWLWNPAFLSGLEADFVEAAASTSTSATSSAAYDSGGNLLSSTSSGSRSLDLELRYARPVIPSRSGLALQAPRTPTRITTNSWTGLALRLGVETRIMPWLRLQAGVKQFAELKANRVTTSPATDQTNTTTLSTYTRFYGGAGVDVAGWAIDLSLPSASSGTKEITYQTNEKDVSGSSSASLSLTARRSF